MRISDWSSDVCSSDLFSLNCQRTLFGQAAKRPVFPVLELGLKINHSLRKQQAGVAIAVKSITARNGMRIASLHSLPPPQCAYQHEQCSPGQRSEERRVGKESFSTVRSRGWPEQ